MDTSRPTRVIGDGTPASCTSDAVVDAVAAGGIITFACGPAPETIVMEQTAKVVNANGSVVLDGGGAVFVRGGRFTAISSRFVRNACDPTGQDLGGAALRVLSQHAGNPVYVVSSTFGGAPDEGGRCSNGGAVSSIGCPGRSSTAS